MSKVFKYVLDFSANTQKFGKDIGGVKSLVKGAAVAAGALFAADKIMDAANAVADYAKEISNVNIQVQKLTGAQGAALDQMTGQVQALAGAYGDDVESVLEAQNTLMQNFGDSSKAAFDVLNSGYASAANSGGDFLKQVSEYSAHFKEAGLNASQMVAVIAQGNKMGVFDDKAADSIKEASLRLREMTSSTQQALQMIGLSSTQIQQDIASGNKSMFEVMQMVSRQLKTLPAQSPAVGAALADIFGGPGEDGIKFVRMLAGLNTNLDDVVAKSGEAGAAQKEWGDTLKDFHTIGSQVFGGTNTLILKVKTAALKFVIQFAKGIVDLANYFIDLYNDSMVFRGAINAIGLGFKTAFSYAKFFFSSLFDLFKSTGRILKAVFKGDFSAIPGLLKSAFNATIVHADDFGKEVGNSFKNSIENTLTPKVKYGFITLSADEAGKAGADMAKNFSKGYSRNTNIPAMAVSKTATVSVKTDPKKLLDMTAMLNNQKQIVESLRTSWSSFGDDFNKAMDQLAAGGKKITAAHMLAGDVINSMMSIAQQGIGSLREWANAVRDAALQAVNAWIAEGVAGAVSTALAKSGIPFPLNMVAGAVAAAGATSLLSAVVPKFEMGGVVPGNSFMGDKMLVRVNSGEEILRRDDPRHRYNSGMGGGGAVMNVMFAQEGITLRGQTMRIGIKKSERMSKYLGR